LRELWEPQSSPAACAARCPACGAPAPGGDCIPPIASSGSAFSRRQFVQLLVVLARRLQRWHETGQSARARRQTARENYKKLDKLPPEKKQSLTKQWEEYNRLPEQERRKLGSAPRKPPATTAAPKAPATSAPVKAASGAQSEALPAQTPPAPGAAQAQQ